MNDDGENGSAASCPVCRSQSAKAVIDLGRLPVFCNVLWPSRELARNAPRGPLVLHLCEDCGMIGNSAFDSALVSYDGGYENSLHFSPTFQEYADRLVARLVDRYDLRRKTIVEIGSGRGDFLRMLCSAGSNTGVGFDPAYEGPEFPAGDDVRLVADTFSRAHADLGADLVCCRHVLEHIEDPREFVTAIRDAMDEGAVLYLEMPAAEYMLETAGVWDVIYEHCSFFTEPALRGLLESCGFEVLATGRDFGGQYLWAEASPSRAAKPSSTDASDLVEQARMFAARSRAKVDEAGELLRSRKAASVALWGAGSKGVTFLNLVPAGTDIGSVVDVNPHKQGGHIAGAGQAVVPPEDLARRRVGTVLITNPLYREEVEARLADTGTPAEVVLV
jgi:SAM-dependent methyltransferase